MEASFKFTKPVILILLIGFFSFNSFAGHVLGGSITYKSLGGNKYSITVQIYRDCREIPFNSPSMQIIGVNSGNTATPGYSLTKIEDITPVCTSRSRPCTPQNVTISGTEPGIEKHTFTLTYDFTAFKAAGNCQVMLGAGQCCRNNAISTGAAGENFWIWCMIDICATSSNNSPVFGDDPIILAACNSPIRYNPAVTDINNDSLVYELVDPMQNWDEKTPWKGGFNAQNPFTTYSPLGHSKYPNPSANPPIGFYFDKFTGNMVFTPTSCSEVSIWSLIVYEYRKDSGGNYRLLGYITRDIETIIRNAPNNIVPVINAPDNLYIPDNSKICFNVSTDDKAFVPRPGDTIHNDTTTLSMFPFAPLGNNTVTFTLSDSKAKLKTATVCWDPKGMASNIPYTMKFKVRDNACTYYSSSYKTVNIHIFDASKTSFVTGRTFYDNNRNCINDAGDNPLPKQKITFGTGTIDQIESDSSAKFERIINPGTYTFRISNPGSTFGCPKTLTVVRGNSYSFELGTNTEIDVNGVNSIKTNDITIFPNPAIDHIRIETTKPGNYTILLTYITGRLIKQDSFTGNNFELNINIEKGLYQLQIMNEEGISVNKKLLIE